MQARMSQAAYAVLALLAASTFCPVQARFVRHSGKHEQEVGAVLSHDASAEVYVSAPSSGCWSRGALMAATWVAVRTSTRRTAGWASGATCRLLELRRGGWGRGCSTGVYPLVGSSAGCLSTTSQATVIRYRLNTHIWLFSFG